MQSTGSSTLEGSAKLWGTARQEILRTHKKSMRVSSIELLEIAHQLSASFLPFPVLGLALLAAHSSGNKGDGVRVAPHCDVPIHAHSWNVPSRKKGCIFSDAIGRRPINTWDSHERLCCPCLHTCIDRTKLDWAARQNAVMAKDIKHGDGVGRAPHHTVVDEEGSLGEVGEQRVQTIAIAESRKIGVTGAVFLILNKMIGTGSTSQAGFLSTATYTTQFPPPPLTACDYSLLHPV